MIAAICVIVVGVAACALAIVLRHLAKLPVERPNKNWVPTAAEIVGRAKDDRYPQVRFTPPGFNGISELPAAMMSKESSGRLLVLLDPLNPVTPYQMIKWRRHDMLVRCLAWAGAALIVGGAIALVLVILL